MTDSPVDGSIHPLLAARPPATDHITYLAIIEVNLKKEDLPLLLEILQDEDLTRSIGWDLVMTLLPMLPESEPCLKLIARIGNPREVMLKTTEALRIIEHEPVKSEDDDDERGEGEGEGEDEEDHIHTHGCSHHHPASPAIAGMQRAKESPPIPVSVTQFQILIEMLQILHPRIKTKYPSRFLSTTLQAVLASFSEGQSHIEDMSSSVIALIKTLTTLSGGARPELPPRSASTASTTLKISAPDPEAAHQTTVVSEEDKMIQRRLLLSFLTHVFELYVESLPTDDNVPGLAWSARIFENTFPQRSIPGRKSTIDQFEAGGLYESRAQAARTFLSLALEAGATFSTLLHAASAIDALVPESETDEIDPPTAAEEIPLSSSGALYLLTESKVASFLQNRAGQHSSDNTAESIFPAQSLLARNFIGREEIGGLTTAGSEQQAVIDSITALGLLALEENEIGEPESDEEFMLYLQRISLVSANTPSASLRFQAHTLTTSVLRSHPSDFVRLTFIRDTLEHCPYENLKASAVSWIKGETLEANASGREKHDDEDSVFATPIALDTLGPFLFPDLTQVLNSPDLMENWITFRNSLSFYLASLNFYYMLLIAEQLHEPLDVASLKGNHNVSKRMMGPLRRVGSTFRESLEHGGELAEEEGPAGARTAMLDLDILDDVLSRVDQGLVNMSEK